ncbi:hypothetical protein M595_4711 [Lyngbya aestuarii BL J]|uniref:Uncharacterized protein n=1 Tax=Lyngbya aestuarii BL J TaxID=1348334 RepID=U7QE80_9CYAN|nr:hypothetical protein M595_4711 [Lyngbya aestuarii BL J]
MKFSNLGGDLKDVGCMAIAIKLEPLVKVSFTVQVTESD